MISAFLLFQFVENDTLLSTIKILVSSTIEVDTSILNKEKITLYKQKTIDAS